MNTQSKSQITGFKAVNGGKIQIEVSENKNTGNVLGLFNASDDKFSGSERKAWMTAEPADAKRLLPSLASKIDEVLSAGVGNSVECKADAVTATGIALRVEIKEAFEPLDDYQAENISSSVKQNPTKGTVLLADNNGIMSPIFSKTKIVGNEPNDVRIAHTAEIPLAEFNAQLAGATATANTEQVS